MHPSLHQQPGIARPASQTPPPIHTHTHTHTHAPPACVLLNAHSPRPAPPPNPTPHTLSAHPTLHRTPQYGADVFHMDDEGRTPLDLAEENNRDCCEALRKLQTKVQMQQRRMRKAQKQQVRVGAMADRTRLLPLPAPPPLQPL